MKKMKDVLFEAPYLVPDEAKNQPPGTNDGDELHVFDFDETLGLTTSSTAHIGVKLSGQDWLPIENYAEKLKAAMPKAHDVYSWQEARQKGIVSKEYAEMMGSVIGEDGKIKPDYQDKKLVGCEVAIIGTHGYKDFKKMVETGGIEKIHAERPVIWYSHSRMMDNTNWDQGTELHIVDYSPASELGAVTPIQLNIDTAKNAQMDDDMVGVVTARKGKEFMNSFLGQNTIKAKNIDQIDEFLMSQGVDPDFTYGAADIDNDGAINKAIYIKKKWVESDKEDLYFYDDDKANLNAVLDTLPDDPEIIKKKPGATINTYWANDFSEENSHKVYKSVKVGSRESNPALPFGDAQLGDFDDDDFITDYYDFLADVPTDVDKASKEYLDAKDTARKMRRRRGKDLDKLRRARTFENRLRAKKNALIIAETVKYLASNSSQRKVLRENCHKSKGRMLDYGHQRSDSGEGKMTKAKLFRMAQMAQRLHDKIFGYDDLPEWVQDKITTAEDRLKTAHDYILYKIWRMENE